MVLGRVLKAQVVLRGLVIEWVKVKAFNEDFATEDGKVGVLRLIGLVLLTDCVHGHVYVYMSGVCAGMNVCMCAGTVCVGVYVGVYASIHVHVSV